MLYLSYIYLNDIFMFISKCNLCHFADDDTLHASGKNLTKNLEMGFIILHKWFHEKQLILNPEECYYMVISTKDPPHKIILNNNENTSSNAEKLLGILLDCKLNFESLFYRKLDQNINPLAKLKTTLHQIKETFHLILS